MNPMNSVLDSVNKIIFNHYNKNKKSNSLNILTKEGLIMKEKNKEKVIEDTIFYHPITINNFITREECKSISKAILNSLHEFEKFND